MTAEKRDTGEPRAEPDPPEYEAPAGMRGTAGPLLRLIHDQRVAFLLVGATNTAVGALWFILFQILLQATFGYMVVLLCAHVLSVLCAFVLYRRFVFRVRGHVWRDLGRFEVVNLTALGINAALLPVLVELVGLRVLPAQLLIAAGTVVVTFFGHRDFSFRRTQAERSAVGSAGEGPA